MSEEEGLSVKERALIAYNVKTVRGLAAILNRSEQTVHKWLNRRTGPPKEFLEHFKTNTGRSIDWLLTGTHDNPDDRFKVLLMKRLDGSNVPLTEPLKTKIIAMLDLLLEKDE